MRRILIIALVIMAGACSVNAIAGDKVKKDKKKGESTAEAVAPVTLLSSADSISYAAGMRVTNGLLPYLTQQMGMDTTYIADFIRGLQEVQDKVNKDRLTAYGAGINIGNMVEQRMIPGEEKNLAGITDSINSELFYRGFIDAIKKDTAVLTLAAADSYYEELKNRQVEAQKAAGAAFLAANGKKEGVVTLPSGLQYKVLREGNGPVATASDEVVVKYEGRLINGTVFDSSYTRKDQTNKFKPTQVIKGWTEALTMMPQGSMWELYIPENLAYGSRQAGQIPPYSTLIFKVELEDVVKAAAPAEPVKTIKVDTPNPNRKGVKRTK